MSAHTFTTVPRYDLVVRGGTVVDPGQGMHARKDVALERGLVAAIEDDIPAGRGRQVLDASGLLVTPGLIDVHTHVYYGVSHYGIEPDSTSLAKGVTTVLDTGSAGAHTFPTFLQVTIDVPATPILAPPTRPVLGEPHNPVGPLCHP